MNSHNRGGCTPDELRAILKRTPQSLVSLAAHVRCSPAHAKSVLSSMPGVERVRDGWRLVDGGLPAPLPTARAAVLAWLGDHDPVDGGERDSAATLHEIAEGLLMPRETVRRHLVALAGMYPPRTVQLEKGTAGRSALWIVA